MATPAHAITMAQAGTGLAQTTQAWDVVRAYLDELDAGPKTRETYRRALKQYTAWLATNGVTLDQTTRAHIMAYKSELAATRSAQTTNCYLVAVRNLHTWIHERTGYPDVARGVKGLKRASQQAKDALTVAQAKDLLAAPAEGEQALRDKAMVSLMLLRGLRTVEVSRANVGDLRSVGGKCVLYVQGKGHTSKDDFVVLDGRAEADINAYLRARGHAEQDAPLFAGTGNRNKGGRLSTRAVSRIAKDAMKRQGMDSPRLTAHSLRHTAVTLSLVGGATVQEAQAMARHASINTTMIYAHNLQRLDARAEHAIDALLAG